jgi:Protein of unknown function (DUF1566)
VIREAKLRAKQKETHQRHSTLVGGAMKPICFFMIFSMMCMSIMCMPEFEDDEEGGSDEGCDHIDVACLAELMWAKTDNGEGLSFTDAETYADDFTLAGFSDWRLPSEGEELSDLYEAGNPQETECDGDDHRVYIRDLFDLSCNLMWTSKLKDDVTAWAFNFELGQDYEASLESTMPRVLVVRDL